MYIEVGQYLGQDGVWLKNDETRLFIQAFGGMTPEFSRKMRSQTGDYWLNAHWMPHFKAPFSGRMDNDDPEQRAYWQVELLRQAAGTFPCAPAFGPGTDNIPTHGDTANNVWSLASARLVDSGGESYAKAVWHLAGEFEQLKYQKTDYLRQGDSSHYMVMTVENNHDYAVPINMAWHTTLGSPFVERGCWLLDNCQQYQVCPQGTEFDTTASLELGARFESLSDIPTRTGGKSDLSLMPGYNGHAEFISGVSSSRQLLWSACYNPYYNLVYVSVIPLAQLEGQVSPSFMNYWIHSGGREMMPWADYDGGCDRNYALGLECAIGGSCKGYEWSRENPQFLNKPTYFELAGNSTASFVCINSFFSPEGYGRPITGESQLTEMIEQYIRSLDISFDGLQAR